MIPEIARAKEIVILDIETTGFSREKHAEIIEIGAVKLDMTRRKVVGIFNQLIRPSEAFSISEKITNITTIDWDQVKDKPYIEEVLPSLYDFIADLPVIAHNAGFDWDRFLVPCFESAGLHAENPVLCTMALAKELYPKLGKNGYNLEALCKKYGSEIQDHHRAYVDCKYTASLFLRLFDEYRKQHEETVERTPECIKLPQRHQESFNSLRIYRISYYAGKTKLGPKIYVYTNLGVIFYTPSRKLWTVQELRTENNAPAQEWGRAILNQLNNDADAFTKKYAEIA